jgi:hypothetical protein
MPTDKFTSLLDTFRLELKIPYFLSSNTTWYVRPLTGSDTLTDLENKGKTEGTAFKSLNTAMQFVATYFNFGSRIGTIDIGAGTYPEFTLPRYNSTTGRFVLRGSTTGTTLIEKTSGTGAVIESLSSAGRYDLYDINTRHVVDGTGTVSNGKYGVQAISGTEIYLYGGTHTLVETSSSIGAKQILRTTGGGARIGIATGGVHLIGQSSLAQSTIRAFYVQFSSDVSLNANMVVTGDFDMIYSGTIFSSFTRSADLPRMNVNGEIATGRRYTLSAWARVGTRGGGEEFFPGTQDGVISANSQYT